MSFSTQLFQVEANAVTENQSDGRRYKGEIGGGFGSRGDPFLSVRDINLRIIRFMPGCSVTCLRVKRANFDPWDHQSAQDINLLV